MYTNSALAHSLKWEKLIKFYESRIQLITDYYYYNFTFIQLLSSTIPMATKLYIYELDYLFK